MLERPSTLYLRFEVFAMRPVEKSRHFGPRVVRPLGLFLTYLIITSTAGAQNIVYDHTSFLHGTGSSSVIWKTAYPDLGNLTTPEYLRLKVTLDSVNTPDLHGDSSWSVQVKNFRTNLIDVKGKHVVVTHSLGGLVARGTYLNLSIASGADARPYFAGIVTIAATHQGTWLANNATRVEQFLGNVQHRVNDALAIVKVEAEVIGVLEARALYGKGHC